MGNVGKWTVAIALCACACAKSGGDTGQPARVTQPPPDPVPSVDAGPQDPPKPPEDPNPPKPVAVKPVFGTPGPWPVANVTYGSADGIRESPVVGVSTDEPVRQPDGSISQNLWVATNSALYLLRPGEKKFTRFDGKDGLHLPGFPAASCDDASGTLRPCPNGEAAPPGINEIVGGGSGDGYLGEVFVGYWGHHDWSITDGTWTDPWRHSGKLDRVRLKADASGKLSLEVIRFDMVSNATVEFWHNKTVYKMVYDHFIHPHELYVGTDHGVTKFSPDKWKPNDPPPNHWFLAKNNAPVWMSDHLHPRACYHKPCTDDSNLRLGTWRGMALDAAGDLWVAGRYAAGKIRYIADNNEWWVTPRRNDGLPAQSPSFGDPYDGNCSGNRPVFCTPLEGDYVNLSGVAVAKDGTIWFTSGVLFNQAGDVNYGIASWKDSKFTYHDPIQDAGMVEQNVRDMLLLPDGRLVLAGPTSGLTFWDPVTGKRSSIRAGQGIPDDVVLRIQLDTMVDPPALQVATRGGVAVLRVLP